MEKEKELSINYSKKVLDHLNEFQGFIPTDMIRVYHNDLNNFILDKMNTSLKISADVFVDDKKLEKWAKMCMALENMTKEEIENIAVRHYVEKLENKMNNKLAKYERAFEILKDKGIVEIENTNIGSVIYKAYGYERYLEQEEYELLEELMKDESRKVN